MATSIHHSVSRDSTSSSSSSSSTSSSGALCTASLSPFEAVALSWNRMTEQQRQVYLSASTTTSPRSGSRNDPAVGRGRSLKERSRK